MKAVLRFLTIAGGLMLILVLTLALAGLDVGASLALLARGSLTDTAGIHRTLVRTTPLLLAGLGILVAWKAGMFNIGGEGQYIMGGVFGATLAALMSGFQPSILNILILLASILGGALYAGLAGLLYIYRGVQVVISTILLNFIALNFMQYMVRGPLQEPTGRLPRSAELPNEVMLYRFNPQTDLHSGIFIAFLAMAVLTVYLFLARSGFELRLVGENPNVARAHRISAAAVQMRAIIISGGLCGLAGGVTYVGVTGLISDAFSQNWGFLAIPVALLGGLHPLGVGASSLYFGALFAGSERLAMQTPIGTSIVIVVQGVAVLAYVGLRGLSERQRQMRRSQR